MDAKQKLITNVKLAGLYLTKNADKIIGDLDLINDFNIELDFCDYDGMIYTTPKIRINQVHFVNKEINNDGKSI